MKKHFIGKFFCLIMAVVAAFGIAGCNTDKPRAWLIRLRLTFRGTELRLRRRLWMRAVTQPHQKLLPKAAGLLKAGIRKRAAKINTISQPKR